MHCATPISSFFVPRFLYTLCWSVGLRYTFCVLDYVFSVITVPQSAESMQAWSGNFNFSPYIPFKEPAYIGYANRWIARSTELQFPYTRPGLGPITQAAMFAYDGTYVMANALHKLLYEEGLDPSLPSCERFVCKCVCVFECTCPCSHTHTISST